MEAVHRPRRGNAGLILVSGALLLALAAYNVGGTRIIARPHAVERHGEQVEAARAAFGQHDPRQQRRECPATDRVINMTPLDTGQWAVMIEGLTSHIELTCWIVSAKDAEKTWLRLLQMHKCPPDAAQSALGHDFYYDEVR